MTKNASRPLTQGLRVAACLCGVMIATSAAAAGPPSDCEHAVLTLAEAAQLLRVEVGELEQLAEEHAVPTRRVGSEWRFNCSALMQWLTGDRDPARASAAVGARSAVAPSADSYPLADQALAAVKAKGRGTIQEAKSESAPPREPQAGQDAPIGEAPEEPTAEDVFLRGQRVLLGRGEVVVDFGQFYGRTDDLLLASVDRGIALTTVEQHTSTTLLVGRVGILTETEIFASTTFHNQGQQHFFGSANLGSSTRNGFGGLGLGIRHTFMREGSGRPDVVGTFSAQLPTGDNSPAVGGGVVLVKSADPVVLFAGANYLRAFASDLSVGRLEAGNVFDVTVGYGLGLNDTLAVSMGVSGLFTGTATLNDVGLRQPGVFSAQFGVTSRLAEGLYLEPSVSFALSGPRASFALGVTMPYAF